MLGCSFNAEILSVKNGLFMKWRVFLLDQSSMTRYFSDFYSDSKPGQVLLLEPSSDGWKLERSKHQRCNKGDTDWIKAAEMIRNNECVWRKTSQSHSDRKACSGEPAWCARARLRPCSHRRHDKPFHASWPLHWATVPPNPLYLHFTCCLCTFTSAPVDIYCVI